MLENNDLDSKRYRHIPTSEAYCLDDDGISTYDSYIHTSGSTESMMSNFYLLRRRPSDRDITLELSRCIQILSSSVVTLNTNFIIEFHNEFFNLANCSHSCKLCILGTARCQSSGQLVIYPILQMTASSYPELATLVSHR
jgi:hypothetical protein